MKLLPIFLVILSTLTILAAASNENRKTKIGKHKKYCEAALKLIHNGDCDQTLRTLMNEHFVKRGIKIKKCNSKTNIHKDFTHNARENKKPKLSHLPKDCGEIDSDRIFGGEYANLYENPWMALLSSKRDNGEFYYCGGTIVNSKYILTAAHCVQENIQKVRVGEFRISTDADCDVSEYTICDSYKQDLDVDEIIPHEGYIPASTNGFPPVNDIALLRVKGTIDVTRNNVKPICLPKTEILRDLTNITEEIGLVTGWGLTETIQESDILRKVTVPIKPCKEEYRRYDKIICAGDINKDSCSGDSGGPLLIQKPYDGAMRYVQYGIVSHGATTCGTESNGSVYTDVTKYMDWILSKMRE
ncbi:CLIP domain-containing serine protease HP8-like isoform X1 [Leptidea sinapis]|uniref:CLIP domain-containing serine protease HP8-like isoform X1 n=1 Tax=Leptidea sinapis TaxID=189913 RepID=UPI0021395270|nr:CLIP domain-containing serine protease HP8-like isoform X1 [Leptidea sinapis]